MAAERLRDNRAETFAIVSAATVALMALTGMEPFAHLPPTAMVALMALGNSMRCLRP